MEDGSGSNSTCTTEVGVWLVFPTTFITVYVVGFGFSSAAYLIGRLLTHRRKNFSPATRTWSDSVLASYRRLKQLCRKLVSGDNLFSQLVISAALFCNLVYMALAFQRAYHPDTRCFSSLAEVPDLAVELVVSIPLIVFFAVRLLAADNLIVFWLKIHTIIDVVTLPNVFIALSLGQDWLNTNALRFVWLTQLTDVLRFLPFIRSQDTVEAVALLVKLVALWMGATGLIHLLETTGDPWNNFNNQQSNTFLEYAYFIMVTMSTVGYGDYFAMTDVGRAFMTFFIIAGIAFFAFALPNLVDLVVSYYQNTRWSKFDTTRVPRHVLVCGHITHTIASDFLKDFLHEDRGDRKTHVLFMHTERPTPELRAVLRSYYTRVQYVVGSVLKASDLAKAKIPANDKFSECRAVFILAEKHCKDPEAEDRENLLRLVSIKNTASNIPVTIQVLLSSSKELISYIPHTSSDVVICLTELKLGLLAQSCLCPGLSTLVGNFFYVSEELKDASGWLELYGKGVSKELYITSFSSAFTGLSFYAAAQLCYEKLGLILLAVEDKQSGMLYLSPSSSAHPNLSLRGASHDGLTEPMVGYFIGTDQEDVDQVALYQEEATSSDKGLGGIPLAPLNSSLKRRRVGSFYRSRHFNPSFSGSIDAPNLHLCDPQPMSECVVGREGNRAASHVLLCVFADDKSSPLYLRNFLKPLRRSTLPVESLLPVTIISSQEYLEKEWSCINDFPKLSVLPGSPLDWNTLSQAGVQSCKVCVILTATKSGEEEEEAALRDKEAILCSLMIHNHHTKVGSRVAPPLIITDLIEESNVQFLDIEDEDDDEGHIYSAQPFACGEAFAASLFDSITSSTFHSPGILFLVEQLISASSHDQCSTQSTITCSPLSHLPPSAPQATFGQLYSYMLTQNKTPVAISRLLNPAPSEGGTALSAIVPMTTTHREVVNSQRFVVTAPPPDTPLLPSDHLLVLEELHT